MNIVKQVEFMGDTLLTIKDNTGIYVGVRWVCQGLGLTENQIKHQTLKVSGDVVLSKGGRKIFIPTTSGTQDVTCLDITYLPLWLAKINANIVKPEIQSKLIEYQLRAKDVLADAFVPQYVNHSIPQLPTTFQEALRLLADSHDTIAVQTPKVVAYDRFLSSHGNQSISQVAKALGTGRDRLYAFLRSKGILMSNNEPYQCHVNSGYFEVIETVGHGWLNSRTMVTAKGVAFIDKLLHPDKDYVCPIAPEDFSDFLEGLKDRLKKKLG